MTGTRNILNMPFDGEATEGGNMRKLLLLAAMVGMVMLLASPAMGQEEALGNCPPGTTAVEGGCMLEDGTIQTPDQLFACEGLGPGVSDERLISCGIDDPAAYRAQFGPGFAELDPPAETPAVAAEAAPALSAPPASTSAEAPASATTTALPNTGGASLMALAVGGLLVAGGLLIRRR